MKLSKILLILLFLLFIEGFFHNFQTDLHDSYLKNDDFEISENLNLSGSQQEYYLLNWTKEVDNISWGCNRFGRECVFCRRGIKLGLLSFKI
ncbi:hypothetical protein ES705_38217 [subsurface metagenome]